MLIHVVFWNCLLHSLWMLPHLFTLHGIANQVHLQLCVEIIDRNRSRNYYPLAVALCTHCIWKWYSCSWCILSHTVLWRRSVSYATYRMLVSILELTAPSTLSSFCMLFLPCPTCAGGMNSLVSTRQWCTVANMSVWFSLIWILILKFPWCSYKLPWQKS